MKQSRHHMAEVIGAKTLHATDTKLLAREIAAYLLEEKQTGQLESLVRDIIQYRAEHGMVEAVASSVSELPDDVIRDVRALLKAEYPEAKHIAVRQKRDERIIGGLKVDLANEQLDMSVQAKLNKFKRLTAHERNNV